MKKLLIAVTTALAFSSCLQPSVLQQEERVITFNTSSITTRASLEEADMTDLWVFVDDQLKIHQTSADAEFGNPTLSLSHGDHVLKFIASRGTDPSYDNGIMTWGKVLDTFAKEMTLTIDDNTSATQSIRLERIVSRLQLVIKDVMPENLASATIVMSKRSMGVSVLEMASTTTEESEQTFYCPQFAGFANAQFTVYTILTDDDISTDVSVILTDNDGNELINRTIENVPLTRNTSTILQGYLFDADITSTIGADNVWATDNEIDF